MKKKAPASLDRREAGGLVGRRGWRKGNPTCTAPHHSLLPFLRCPHLVLFLPSLVLMGEEHEKEHDWSGMKGEEWVAMDRA